MQDKSAEVASNIKAVNVETKKVQQELKTNNSNDQSGYLDVSTIETYGNAIDKVLGNIAQKQEDINAKRQRAVELEKDILSNTTLTREGLSREFEEYTKVLNKFDTEKITKLAASLKETRTTAAEHPAQVEQPQSIQPLAQPKKKKEPVKFAGGSIPSFNEGLKGDKKAEETTVPIKGKVTITDADITVDVKNPVKIPGVAVIDSSAAQVGNADDLKASADALSLANKSLNGIISKTEGYVSNISALGPAFQYVAQEVDNLSRSLENQILDFSKISEQTNAYIGKAGSISIDTSNVAVTGEPATITGKVVLGTDDVVPPETPVDIKGHVELETTDITPPSEPVELQGKISKTTMESTAKGKKKKGQDVDKPEVVELNGHVKLEDKDIERPDPVKFNGAVKIKDSDIKVGDIEISKKKFDINGNLILKNAEIANAIKEAAGKESGKKASTKSKTDSTIIDTKAQQEANRLLQQEEQLQQKIADAAQKKAEAENKSFNRDVAATQKKYNQAELDNLKEIESIYKRLASLERKRGRYTKPEQAFDLHQTEEQISAEEADLNRKMLSASEVGYNPLKVTSIRKQALEYYYAQASSDNKFDTVKKQEAIKIQQEANEALRQEEVVREKITEAAKKQEDAENKILMRDIAAQEKKDASDGSKAIDDIVSSYQKIISLQKQRGKFVDSKDKEDLDEINNQLSEEENHLSELMFNFQDSTGVNPYQFTAVSKIAELAEKEYQSLNKTIDIKRNGKVQDLVDQLSAEQKKYGTVEEAEAAGKIPTSIQLALQTQQQLIDAIGKTTIGTEEYNNAVKAAEANWKNVKIEINASNKAQKKLSDQTTSILRKFEVLKEEASQGSNEELKNGIEGILTRTRNLNTQDPHTYENYANELIQLKQDSYAVQAKHTLWHKGYKGLEKKGAQIAQGVEVARQMQEDGSLQDIDFKNIDELIAKLNTLHAQSDTYAETLKEIDALWQEIKKKVDAVNESEKQAAKKQTAKIRDVKNILTAQRQNKNLIETVRGNNGSGEEFYSQLSEKQSKLNLLFEAIDGASDSEQALKAWANQNLKESADNINSVTDAIRTLDKEYNDAQSSAESFNRTISQERSTNKAATEVANLKSQIHDYLETNKKIQSSNLAQPFQNLMNALNSETAPEKIGELKKQFAELRVQAKELGLESENLFDKFEKLFGQHLSTMITMAALHKMQDALRIVYQNVVEIDTAVTELRKVSEYAGKSLEEYMSRASEQAQKLGVSISNYVNSTADWKRLGYSDEDAENMATYSTLLKNVGDGIDDVNTSSSYLISTLQGFGLLADQAEDVVNKIDAVANTQPVTANDLGEILTRSSAAMAAANNTLEETLALGTAANSVVQDADSVGTMLKSLSMYLRAAKTDAENAGIEVDGMANSVSELRSELKSLTGVDIMLDSKNFKSTYQIMKELSQVWGNLSDVTQANVTEMIAGKRNSNAVSAILNNFSVAESTMESAANSANVAWEENEKYLDSIQGRLAQLDASFQVLSTDVLSSDLVKSGVSFLTSIVKFLDKIINLTGALPAGLGIAAFATQLGEPKMTGFMIVPSNTPGGDTEQACGVYYIKCCSAREYLVKPTNMAA
nr:MAG TPA: minor tail protein [Caudoviricetes sp.]